MNQLAKTTSIIELHVPDFNPVKKFYGDLGFTILWEYPAKGQEGYLTMKLEENILAFFCGTEEVYNHDYFKKFSKETPRGYAVEVTLFVTSPIEDYYNNIKKNYSNSIVEKLVTRPWGIKDFRIVDPFGFYIRISEPTDMSKP